MPRKARQRKPDEPAPISDALDAVIAKAGLKPASEIPAQLPPPELELQPLPKSELPPPDRELIRTAPDQARPRDTERRNGEKHPGFTQRVRPEGPRERDPSEPANVFASEGLRIDRDGHMMQVTARRELTGEEKDFISRQGFTPVDDDERVFNVSQKEIIRARGDVNAIGFQVGKGGRAR